MYIAHPFECTGLPLDVLGGSKQLAQPAPVSQYVAIAAVASAIGRLLSPRRIPLTVETLW
eukprot:7035850-Pyramimonas_sp.AAC.1